MNPFLKINASKIGLPSLTQIFPRCSSAQNKMNCNNFITEKSSTRLHAPPGGKSRYVIRDLHSLSVVVSVETVLRAVSVRMRKRDWEMPMSFMG
jgi:hypothetical protein